MAMPNDDEGQQNFILAFVLGLIAVVIFFVLGLAIHHSRRPTAAATMPPAVAAPAAKPAATTVAEVTETVTVIIPDGASIRVAGGVVNFYFASGSADLAPGAAEALAAVIKGVEGGRRALVSGFHDTTGDAAINQALAKRRAETVRDVLTGLGMPAAKVELKQPELTAGSGNDTQARRVEVRLVD